GPTVGGDFFVRQHGAETGAPVDRYLGHVGQAVGVEDLAAARCVQVRPRGTGGVGAGSGLAAAGVELLFQLGNGSGAACIGVVPAVEELEEDPLGPAVVALVG